MGLKRITSDLDLARVKGRVEAYLRSINNERAASLASLLLIAAFAYTAASLTWTLMPMPQTGDLAPIKPASLSSTQGITRTQHDIAALHLFGSGAKLDAIGEGTQIDAPETNLRLSLLGVIASTNPAIARAIIAAASGDEKDYSINDKLPGGAVLKEILADRVILSRNGRYETLTLPKNVLNLETPAREESPRREQRSKGGANIRPEVSLEEVNRYKSQLLTNPKELIGLIRTRPVSSGGKLKGYKVFPGKDRDLFNRLGLKSGDVVTSVNGMPLSDPATGVSILGQLSTMTEVQVELERRGQQHTVSMPLNE